MASEWPDQWSVDCVSKLARTDRRELFRNESDPFRAGSSLRDFPCRPIEEYLLLRSRGRLIGMHGILQADVWINEELVRVGGVAAFYLVPDVRGKGWSSPFHWFARERMRPWRVAGVMGFCLPPVLAIYLRMGATTIEPEVLISRRDGTLQTSEQFCFWWPFDHEIGKVRSLELSGDRRRW